MKPTIKEVLLSLHRDATFCFAMAITSGVLALTFLAKVLGIV